MALDDEQDFIQQQSVPATGSPYSAAEELRGRPPLLDQYSDVDQTKHTEAAASADTPTPVSEADTESTVPARPEVIGSASSQSGSAPTLYPPAPAIPPNSPEPAAHREAERGRTEQPSPEAIEAVGQAATLQRALINLGEMIGTKYVFEQTLDADAPIDAEYLAVIRRVYAKPRSEDTDRTRSPFA
ncbi:hypothetical protein ACIP4W_34030 [Streptomyces sp. NPDC088846]